MPIEAQPFVEVEPEEGALQQDDTLREIYARETATHVATVRHWLARESQLSEPHT